MKNNYRLLIVLFFCLHSFPALALNYFELEVYGYSTEGPGVVELENITSVSNIIW